MFKLKLLACALAVVKSAGSAVSETWTLNGDASRVAFGSVKSETIGEVHSFGGLNGSVAADGVVTLEIDLATVDTQIEIRNERLQEHVFANTAKAMVNAEIDMDAVSSLSVGESTVVEAFGTLSLAGNEIDLDTNMFVLRLSEGKVMVTTNDMIMVDLEDFGLTDGINKLMELASLPSITRVSPVTLRLVFDNDDLKS